MSVFVIQLTIFRSPLLEYLNNINKYLNTIYSTTPHNITLYTLQVTH